MSITSRHLRDIAERILGYLGEPEPKVELSRGDMLRIMYSVGVAEANLTHLDDPREPRRRDRPEPLPEATGADVAAQIVEPPVFFEHEQGPALGFWPAMDRVALVAGWFGDAPALGEHCPGTIHLVPADVRQLDRALRSWLALRGELEPKGAHERAEGAHEPP